MPLGRGGAAAVLALVLRLGVLGSASAAPSTKGGSKKCEGAYKGAVVNLCDAHWPDAKAEKTWFVLFYAPWCGHCRNIEPKFHEMASKLQKAGEKSIGIGAIDCNSGANQALCGKYGVQGYPTLKAIVSGKPKSYNGARETDPMMDWIKNVQKNRGSKGGSAKCAPGLFKSKVKDSVVPLCEEHFPNEKSKNSWLLVFYNEKDTSSFDLKEVLNRVATDLGNEPSDKSKALKKQQKQRERLTSLAEKYEIQLELPKKGPFGMDPLAKVGGICCDCGDAEGFCAGAIGGDSSEGAKRPRPAAVWIEKGKSSVSQWKFVEGDAAPTPQALIEFSIARLGFTSTAGGKSGRDGEL